MCELTMLLLTALTVGAFWARDFIAGRKAATAPPRSSQLAVARTAYTPA